MHRSNKTWQSCDLNTIRSLETNATHYTLHSPLIWVTLISQGKRVNEPRPLQVVQLHEVPYINWSEFNGLGPTLKADFDVWITFAKSVHVRQIRSSLDSDFQHFCNCLQKHSAFRMTSFRILYWPSTSPESSVTDESTLPHTHSRSFCISMSVALRTLNKYKNTISFSAWDKVVILNS